MRGEGAGGEGGGDRGKTIRGWLVKFCRGWEDDGGGMLEREVTRAKGEVTNG